MTPQTHVSAFYFASLLWLLVTLQPLDSHYISCRTCTVVGLYGHCSQELMNLLLTGRASSNVFDGNVSLTDSCPGAGTVFEDAFLAKGIQQRSEVGYLTHLESLRLCKVPIILVIY